MKKVKIAVYAGSFDPVTNGHLDIIKRAACIFDQLIVAILVNPNKVTLFSEQERKEMLRSATKNIKNVKIECFSGLLVDFMKETGAFIIIRGMRAISDFEYESQLALMNKKLAPEVETIFLVTSAEYSYVNSGIVKEIAEFNGCVEKLVPSVVENKLHKKYKEIREIKKGRVK